MADLRPIDRWFIDEVLPYEQRYLGVALRLAGEPEEARDLVQDVYGKLFATDGWRAIQSPPGYVIRMIRNLAIERMRRARIVTFQQLTEAEKVEFPDDAPDPFRQVAGQDELRRVMTALDELPEQCRTVVIRRRFGNETPREIAKATGISISTLEKRLARGMRLLAAAVSFDGGKKPKPLADETDGETACESAAHA